MLDTLAISMAGLSPNPVLCWFVGALHRLKLALAIMQATIVLKFIFDMKQPHQIGLLHEMGWEHHYSYNDDAPLTFLSSVHSHTLPLPYKSAVAAVFGSY